MMSKSIHRVAALYLVTTLLVGAPAYSQEHLVRGEIRDARLAQQAQGRSDDLATVRSFLESPEVAGAAKGVGMASTGSLARRAQLLDDQDLRDLARRADALKHDPAAGMGTGGKIAIVALVVLIAAAVISMSTLKLDGGSWY